MSDFTIGVHRRIFNKNLKDAIERSGKTAAELHPLTDINQSTLSQIINFHHNPTEKQRENLSLVLEVPLDTLFPEKYDQLYNLVSPASRKTEVRVDFLRLDTPEVLALQAPENPEDKIISEEKSGAIETALYEIPWREAQILRMRNGFDGKVYTLEEVSKKFGVTRERIRQMESKALERLRSKSLLKEVA